MEGALAEQLTLQFDAWEGPLDLLLSLARAQKVDLREISILELARQYIAYVEDARRLDLDVAADHLVMAAWLAYLKSLLLLPREPEADPDPEWLAALLQRRLERLEAMREAGARLMARDRLGRDVFARGRPDGLRTFGRPLWQVSVGQLIAAYGQIGARTVPVTHEVRRRRVMSLDDALARLAAMLGVAVDWMPIGRFVPRDPDPSYRRSALASSFLAALELARQGRAELRQEGAFAPLMLRSA